jgi:quercetin dioxygenase-like cupin family protein
MEIVQPGSRPAQRPPAEWFSGVVFLETLVEAPAPARVRAARVTFEPGARTAWHRHPLGQLLVIASGVALIGHEDGTVEQAAPGATVWFDPGERHWHGATADAPMTHVAIQEADESGSVVAWEEHVSDEQYARGAA